MIECKDGPSNIILASIENVIYATILYSRPKQDLIPVTAVWCAILKSKADVYSDHMLDNAPTVFAPLVARSFTTCASAKTPRSFSSP